MRQLTVVPSLKRFFRRCLGRKRERLGLALACGLILVLLLSSLFLKKLFFAPQPEILASDFSQAWAYYELSADKSHLPKGEPVNVDLWLTTSGHPFSSLVALLGWDTTQFSDQVQVKAGSDSRFSGQFTSQFLTDRELPDLEHRYLLLSWFNPQSVPAIQLSASERAKVATITLTALVDNPQFGVKLLAADNLGLITYPGDLFVGFCGHENCYEGQIANGVQQTLVDANLWQVTFQAPSPSPSPSPSPTQPVGDNHNPVIQTTKLPTGRVGRKYGAYVYAYDMNKKDDLQMTLTQLPPDLKLEKCVLRTTLRRREIKCRITGKPKQKGISEVMIVVQDNQGGGAIKSLLLKIQ